MADDKRERPATPRTAGRLAAIQALYQAEITGSPAEGIVREFIEHRLGQTIDGEEYRSADAPFFAELVEGAAARRDELDALITAALTPEWTIQRLDAVLRALLRAGAFELSQRRDIPARVVISEYVDLAHAFFDGKEPGLANGVLDRLGHSARPAEWA